MSRQKSKLLENYKHRRDMSENKAKNWEIETPEIKQFLHSKLNHRVKYEWEKSLFCAVHQTRYYSLEHIAYLHL